MELRDLVGAPGVLPIDEGRNRILVVDDDMTQRMMMRRMLKRSGYECAVATSTAEARGLMSEQPFGVLITDLRMFNEDGIELVRYASDRYPDLVTIVVTGFADPSMEDRVKRAGAFGILFKPFEPEQLDSLVGEAFGARDEAVALHRHRSM